MQNRQQTFEVAEKCSHIEIHSPNARPEPEEEEKKAKNILMFKVPAKYASTEWMEAWQS